MLDLSNKGESKTVGQKLFPGYLDDYLAEDGNIYAMMVGSVNDFTGLVYNSDIVDGVNFKLPNTTDELEILAMELKDAGHTPFIYFPTGTYWQFVYNVWQAQYDGLDYYRNVFCASSENGVSPNKEVMLRADGRRKVLDALEKILIPDYIVPGSNSEDFTIMQTRFLNGAGVIMPNGNWLCNEMKQNFSDNFLMMKNPVISSIIEKCSTVSDDAELSALIAAVDAAGGDRAAVPLVGDGYNVVRDDANRVYDARNYMTYTGGSGLMVPKYSTAKGAAKDFIKFFYSDKALQIVADVLNVVRPMDFDDGRQVDISGWSSWAKRMYSFADTAIPVLGGYVWQHPIFYKGNASPYAAINIVSQLSARGTDHKSAAQIWQKVVETHNARWESYLFTAGIS